jgi:riboflavin transporter FmnP
MSNSRSRSTQQIATMAVLIAMSTVLMIFPQFPLLPGASFLKLDFSIIPILVGVYMFDLKSGWIILILRSALKMLVQFESWNDIIGMPMNIVAVGAFITIFALMFKADDNMGKFAITSVVATLGLTAAMMVLNYIYAVPMYAAFANFDIRKVMGMKAYMLGAVLPFNVIEGVVFAVIFGLLFAGIKRIIKLK